MDGERKINLSEGVPLNSAGAPSIFLNTGKNTKVNSSNGTVIHLQPEKNSPADLGLHINTTFSIASSKKIKLLFVLNFILSVLCMVLSCTVAFYYWNEISAMRRQIDGMKDQLILLNLPNPISNQDRVQAGALVSFEIPQKRQLNREPRMDFAKDETIPNVRKYYVENLGGDILFVDASKKGSASPINPTPSLPVVSQKEMLVIHYNGAENEKNLGRETVIGPWKRDDTLSSKDSDKAISMTENYFTVNEGGLYLVYAQVVYLSRAPNCYFLWAKQTKKNEPRLLTTCSTGDDSSLRPLSKAQLSCSVQTVARLYKDDIVNLSQREHNRTMWLRPGYTYLGFIKLSS